MYDDEQYEDKVTVEYKEKTDQFDLFNPILLLIALLLIVMAISYIYG
jgi:hypothetical protein